MHTKEFEKFYSVNDLCRLLGYERSTIYSRIKAGRIDAVRLDGALRVPASSLEKYVATAQPVTAAA